MADRFATTRWSLVLAAGGESAAARAALSQLCRIYWRPVYAYVRSWVREHDTALDLTQEFFAGLLRRKDLARVDRQRGRFRPWLLRCIKNFLCNQRRHGEGPIRGKRNLVWLDADTQGSADALSKYGYVDAVDPERAYDRSWTCALLERALTRLGELYAERGKQDFFARTRHLLVVTPGEAVDYAALAPALGVRADTLKVQVCRMRREFGELLRAELGELVPSPRHIDAEIDSLSSVFRTAPTEPS